MKARWMHALVVILAVSLFCPVQSAQAAKKKKAKEKESPPAAETQTKAAKESKATKEADQPAAKEAKTKPAKEAKAKKEKAPKAAATSKPATAETPAATWLAAELTLGIQARDSETEGMGDLLIPVWNPGGKGLLFLNPRASFTDDDAEEANLGIGYRQLLPKQKVILGGNAFYDYRDTGYSHYDQWGLGVELLSTWVDARANYYKPDDEQTIVGSETESSTSRSVSSSEGWEDPYAEDHNVVQDYVVERTETTITTTRTFEQFEAALEGYDWEIGLRLPLPVKPETLEARVFGGYYDFDSNFGDNIAGWKARAELRLAATLFLDAGLYEDDLLTGSDWYAGARVTVPLDLAAIAKGRSPFATAKSRLDRQPRDLSARLTEMVMRDPQIRLEISDFIENQALMTETSSKKSSTDREEYVLLSDVQFVDGDAAGFGDGTGQNPFSSIQQGADAVFGSRIVYVYDASRPYVENVQLQPGTTLWGSSILLPGYDNRIFGSGVQPIVDGASRGPSISMADRTTVQGFFVRNTDMGGPPIMITVPCSPDPLDLSRVGIYGDNVTDLTIAHNTLADNSYGAAMHRNGDFSLLFTDNLVRDNDEFGLGICGTGASGTFNATISRSLFANNGVIGAYIVADNYDESFINVDHSGFVGNGLSGLNTIQVNSLYASTIVRSSDAAGNGASGVAINQMGNLLSVANVSGTTSGGNALNGLVISQADSLIAMAMVDGVNASGNGALGIDVTQENNVFGLANISDTTANNNTEIGIGLTQNSVFASVGLIGAAEGLDNTVNALADLAGFPLPAEVAMFFKPDGPVTASGNGGPGIVSTTTGGILALGGLFDITANNNTGGGVVGTVISPVIAVGLAGSSENWGEILQLGDQVGNLFGLDLPLAIAGNGHFQANGNIGGNGLVFTTVGGLAAISAIVGVETVDNDGWGSIITAQADGLALNAAARINASDNTLGGLLATTVGDNLGALTLLSDVTAQDNEGGDGILTVTASDNGFAALLAMSTDALRPVGPILGEEFLGGPITLPGDPVGPIVANGNAGNGFLGVVDGNDFAAALLFDTQANGNGLDGINLTVNSSNGLSLAGILASDLLIDELPGIFGAPAIPNAGLGPILAQNNGSSGIVLSQTGTSAYAALLSIEADGNLNGDGVHAELTATAGNAFALLLETDAANNSDDGIELIMNASGSTLSALSYVDVASNGNFGVRVVQNSTAGDALALLGGVDAMYNTDAGIRYDLTAGNAAVAAITESESMFNGGRGVAMNLTAGGDAALVVGTNALALLQGSGYLPSPFDVVLGIIADQIPVDEPEFNNNGAAGFYANVTSTTGNVLFDIDGANANNNTNHGFNLEMTALAGNVIGSMNHVVANDNGANGIFLKLNGSGSALNLSLRNLRTLSNDGNGINLEENYNGTVSIYGERIVSTGNLGNGVRLAMSGLTVPIMDFGGGVLLSPGNSSIYGNGNRDFRYNNGGGATVKAENNWWGTPGPGAGQFAGSIDRTPWLLTDPNAP